MIKEPEVLDCLEIDEAADVLQDFSRAGYGFKGNRFEHVSDGVTLLSGELAIIAMPALNNWNGY